MQCYFIINKYLMSHGIILSGNPIQRKTSINFVRPKERSNRLKSKSCFHKPEYLKLENCPTEEDLLIQQYSRLTQQSLNRNYYICQLRPFSAHVPIKQLKKQVESLNLSKNCSMDQYFKPTANIRQKLAQFIENTKKDYNNKKKQYIRSSIKDNYMDLVNDFDNQTQVEAQKHSRITNSFNHKIITNYENMTKKQKQCNNRLKRGKSQGFTKQTKRKLYKADNKIDGKADEKQEIKQLKRQGYGIYSRSVKRTLVNFEDTNTIKTERSASNPRRTRQANALYYKNYLKTYRDRKNVLCRSKQIALQNYSHLNIQ